MAESMATLEKQLEEAEKKRKQHRMKGVYRDKKEGEKLLKEAKAILTKIENLKSKKPTTPEPLK